MILADAPPITYYEWHFARPWPAWMLLTAMLGIVGYTVLFYWRQAGISHLQRGFWSLLRVVTLFTVIVLLLEPVLVYEQAIPIRKSVLVLCDGSLSMSIKDARRSERDVVEAALASGKSSYPNGARDTNLYAALQATHAAATELAEHPVSALESQKRAEEALAALKSNAPADLQSIIETLLTRQKSLHAEAQRLTQEGKRLSTLINGQTEVWRMLEQFTDRLREPVKVDTNALITADASRIDIAKNILLNKQLKLLDRLSANNDVHIFRFGDALQGITVDTKDPAGGKLKDVQATDPGTALGSAIDEAASRDSGQPLAGIVVLTDGGANKGMDPIEVAQRLGKAGTPIFPVGIGVSDSQDVVVKAMTAQEVAHIGDEMQVRVQFESHGFAHRPTDLILKLGSEEVARKRITLNGSAQIEEITFKPAKIGTYVLEASIPPFNDESNKDNNKVQQFLRVTDERVKVLYLEGSPRWEYRYLRQVLLRDPRLDVKFVMTEGDPDLPETSKMYLPAFPKEPDAAFKFDLVILGDVNPAKLTAEQMDRLEELVRKRGGSFLMIAGHFFSPRAYAGTPIEKIAPVELTNLGWMIVPPTVKVRLTPEGERSSVMRLDPEDSVNRALWSLVSPMYDLPRLANVKSGATVLATLSQPLAGEGQAKNYPLIAWQRYGAGKSMFVATDQLWRLRLKRGDRYHAKFWSQAIQVLTFSRLLGENKRVRIETDQKEYQLGERVQLTVNACNEMYEPLKAPSFTVQAQEQAKGQKPQTVTLQAVPDSPGLFQGYYQPATEGVTAFTAPSIKDGDSNTAEVNVINKPLELQDAELQETLLKNMASQSGGRYFPIRDLNMLPEWISGEELSTRVRSEKTLAWSLYFVILFCASLEWFLRRKNDLC